MVNQTAQQPAAQTKSITQLQEVQRNLLSDESKKQFAMALPPQMPVERFVRVAITALNKTPELVGCDRQSLYNSFMLAAQDGLLPDGREAAIVPFAGKASYMPMVGGILKKIRNSGELKSIVANVVNEGDAFRYWVDEGGEHMLHEPILSDEERKVTHVYALAKTKDDGVFIAVLSVREVEKVRSASKVKGAGPWSQWWEQMAKKTAIRRLSKVLPMSTDLDDLIRRDDDLYDIEHKTAEPKAEKGAPGRLQKMLGAPGKAIEGVGRTVTTEPEAEPAKATEEPLVTADTDAAPSAEEQEEIKRREIYDAKPLKCGKCSTFACDTPAQIEAHTKAAHPAAQAAKPAGKGPSSLFTQ